MTIICAITDGKKTWVGADGLAVNNDTIINGIQKWSFAHNWGVASAGDFKTNNILEQNKLDLFDRLGNPVQFVERVRGLFSDYNTDTDVGPKLFGQNLILACQHSIWMIDTALAIIPIQKNMLWADGSGRRYGIGAGNLQKDDRLHKDRIKSALYGAMKHDISCGGKIMIRCLTPTQ